MLKLEDVQLYLQQEVQSTYSRGLKYLQQRFEVASHAGQSA